MRQGMKNNLDDQLLSAAHRARRASTSRKQRGKSLIHYCLLLKKCPATSGCVRCMTRVHYKHNVVFQFLERN